MTCGVTKGSEKFFFPWRDVVVCCNLESKREREREEGRKKKGSLVAEAHHDLYFFSFSKEESRQAFWRGPSGLRFRLSVANQRPGAKH